MEHPILFNGEMVRAILDGRKTQTRRIISIRNTIHSEDIHTNHNAEITNVSRHTGSFWSFGLSWDVVGIEQYDNTTVKCPFGDVGDTLWVRESLRRFRRLDFLENKLVVPNQQYGYGIESIEYSEMPKEEQKWTAQYMATGTAVPYALGTKEGWCGIALWQWKNKTLPSIHMPRWASRITLEITDIRAEKLQYIGYKECLAEGTEKYKNISIDEEIPFEIEARLTKDIFANEWDAIYSKNGFSWQSNPWVWVINFKLI